MISASPPQVNSGFHLQLHQLPGSDSSVGACNGELGPGNLKSSVQQSHCIKMLVDEYVPLHLAGASHLIDELSAMPEEVALALSSIVKISNGISPENFDKFVYEFMQLTTSPDASALLLKSTKRGTTAVSRILDSE
jgi:hypothetical protein